ncbi:DUF485 domain-containing protein [Allofranklinella schreckenbergeri]|uniref:DUF485 domain-containing protein n=1 Tax=Allofranklinella schreckenbergeri TaxID=1076744 RepID=A0A3M6QGQ5_9BURK|nr:DUF485 domain-containing protein [Allofranklinella schreckenbergeri]RMX01459.1 DUF485 domain-containing protein [Allofranklinella schreckenbergeri]RMX01652.1 DUF485 domain-containing protein [Allofranklinella schreckenbergeri]RMX10301.1 DUF485 domain-containing protein [Allofranklinella schreckenbergeri]RRD43987.1 DUF485 domain-containing protein [Comamonadaceae bacterium OH3737_COT-264]
MSTSPSSEHIVQRVQQNPTYQRLRSKRTSFAWVLTILMLVVYYGYIGLIAFNKAALAKPIGDGVTTWGIPIGLGVIVFTIVITGIYVYRANTEFDAMTAEILEDCTK